MIVVQVYDEDSKREDLISETEVDITKVLEDGEWDSKSYICIYIFLLFIFTCVCVCVCV
jgi:hypothetical protein